MKAIGLKMWMAVVLLFFFLIKCMVRVLLFVVYMFLNWENIQKIQFSAALNAMEASTHLVAHDRRVKEKKNWTKKERQEMSIKHSSGNIITIIVITIIIIIIMIVICRIIINHLLVINNHCRRHSWSMQTVSVKFGVLGWWWKVEC
jgi:hypothetical protein